MRRRIGPFAASLAASTSFAFGSLLVAVLWADREVKRHVARVGYIGDNPLGVDYFSLIVGFPCGLALVCGLSAFSATVILGIGRRPWYVSFSVLVPTTLWMFMVAVFFAGLIEEYFP